MAACAAQSLGFHVRAFLLHETNRGMTPSTRSTELFALRSFYRFLIAEDLCRTNPARAVTLPAPSRGRVEFYKDDEAETIIDWVSAQHEVRGQVGRVLLMFLRYTGLRLSELTNLRTEDVDLDARRISLVGKGRKARVVPIPAPLSGVLGDYLDELRPLLAPSPYLFVNPNGKGQTKLTGRYGQRAVFNLVAQAGAAAGLPGRHFPHRWRHTYATSLVRRGVDIHVIQRLLGHSNITTTTRYLHLSDADLLAAVDQAFPTA